MRNLCRWMGTLGLASVLAASAAGANDFDAEDLMRRVRESMPGVPLEMEAAIRVIDRAGRPLRTVRALAHLAPREGGRIARYTLLDGFGGTSQEMTVELGEETSFSFATGDPLQPAPLPDLFGSHPSVGGTSLWRGGARRSLARRPGREAL